MQESPHARVVRTYFTMRYALLLFLALPAFAERVLVPVSYTGGGACGAFWVTSIIAVNRIASGWTVTPK